MNWRRLTDHHRKRLDAHIALLQEYRPALLQALGNVHDCAHNLEIIEEENNLIALRSNTNDGMNTLLTQNQGSTLVQQQRSAITANFERGARLIVLSGIGVGHSLLFSNQLLEQYNSAGVIAWEPDRYAWVAFLSMFDAKPLIEKTERFFLYACDSIDGGISSFIEKRRLFLFPPEKTSYLLGALPIAPALTEQYIQRAKQLAKFITDKNSGFAPVFANFLDKLSTPLSNAPQSVWSCVQRDAYIHFPIAKAFLEGFKQLGLTTNLEPFDSTFGRPFEALGKMFEMQPDMFFSINLWPTALLADLGMADKHLESMQLPRVCWMVDDTLLLADEGPATVLDQNDLVLYCDRSYARRLQKLNCKSSFFPHATIFQEPGRKRDELAADISYVGSLPNVYYLLDAMPVACREMLEKIDPIRNTDYSITFHSILQSLEPTASQLNIITYAATNYCEISGKDLPGVSYELEYFLYAVVTYFKRLRTVEELLPLGLRVFGPPAWKEVLPSEYRDRYGGFISGADLADCYASSKICLNIHSHQCPTCLNPRDFDVPMAGSVVLGDWVEDAERGFMQPGKEILVHHSIAEAVDMVQQYLNDPDELAAIQQQGQQRVMQEHTYKHRAETVLSRVNS